MSGQNSMKAEVQSLEGMGEKTECLVGAGLYRPFYGLGWALFLMSFVYLHTEFSQQPSGVI